MIYYKTKVTIHHLPEHGSFEFSDFGNEMQKLLEYRQTMKQRTPGDYTNGQAATMPIGQGSVKFNENILKGILGSITFVWRTEELANEYMEQITGNRVLSKYATVVFDGTVNETELYIDTEDI